MPAAYEKIRDKAVQQGMSYDAAQTKAAKIYNWMRKNHPGMAKLSNKPEHANALIMSKKHKPK